jgi:predicted small lipoprotein YifL
MVLIYWASIKRILKSPLVTAVILFGIITACVLIGPLLLVSRNRQVIKKSRHALFTLFYFALIGCGYMFIEISFIYQIPLYLGHPVYALSIGLLTFLFASGLGSFTTNKIQNPVMIRMEVILVCLFGMLFVLFGKQVMETTLSFLWWQRAAIIVMITAPLAFTMGMLFPTGVKMLTQEDQGFVPWICAVNTVFSIFSLFAIRLTVLLFNVELTLFLGLGFYLILGIIYSRKTILRQLGT